jgi:hypothetical protein
MGALETAWAVVCRESGELDGDQLDVVEVLRVYWTEEAAREEVYRLKREDPDNNHFYYYEQTEVATR